MTVAGTIDNLSLATLLRSPIATTSMQHPIATTSMQHPIGSLSISRQEVSFSPDRDTHRSTQKETFSCNTPTHR